jgi:hypothetical protein
MSIGISIEYTPEDSLTAALRGREEVIMPHAVERSACP